MSKKKKRKINFGRLLILVVGFVAIIAAIIGLLVFLFKGPDINVNVISNKEDEVIVNISVHKFLSSGYSIAVDNSKNANEDTVYEVYSDANTYILKDGNYYIHVKDSSNKVYEYGGSNVYYLDSNLEYPFYPEDSDITDVYKLIGINANVSLKSSDESVAKVSNDLIHTVSKGDCIITISSSDVSTSVDLEVTDLYTNYDTDSDSKQYLIGTICSDEDAEKLDEVLAKKVEEAGEGTRAGVVAAARFLSLEFSYRVVYFAETGRLTNGAAKVDGEGRFYHKGLYLTEDKFNDISASLYGPATWGEYFVSDSSVISSSDTSKYISSSLYDDIGTTTYLQEKPNGLDCSGFVSWCYYNGGFNFGDLGANDIANLGEQVAITNTLLKSDRIKAGDIIGTNYHVGIVIGVDDDYIWVADTLYTGIRVTKFERNVEAFTSFIPGEHYSCFKYFVLMDSEYGEDGNYTAMWD